MNRNYQLGLNYYNGNNGYEENIEIAIKYFKNALDEKCYEAAYMLGLCYSEAIDDEKKDIKKTLEYMGIADYNYVDLATEWLADYYIDEDFPKFIDYALDLPKYLESKATTIITKLDSYCSDIDLQDYEVVKALICSLEEWWKRIKNPDSKVKKALATKRNQTIRDLCSLLKEYALSDEVREDLKSFLTRYIEKFNCVKEAFIFSDYLVLAHAIKNASSTDDLDIIESRIKAFTEPVLANNLKSNLDNKRILLLIQKDPITENDLSSVKQYVRVYKHHNAQIENLTNAIVNQIDAAISCENYNRAMQLCSLFKGTSDIGLKYSHEIERRKSYNDAAFGEIDKLNRIKEDYYKSHSQIDFNSFFDLLWSQKKFEDILGIMQDAQQHHISFEYVTNKYNDYFLKEIISRLPLSFFASDVAMIKSEIKKRNITTLIHFTPVGNSTSILENGLLSRNELEKRRINALYTDSNRFDGFLNYISVSITRENTRMFWNKMFNESVMKNGAEIIEIDPAILYEHPESAIYCNCNAAKNDASKHRNYGYKGFASMFESDDIYPNNSNMPTDVQSEILFMGHIDKKYIKRHYTKRLYHG